VDEIIKIYLSILVTVSLNKSIESLVAELHSNVIEGLSKLKAFEGPIASRV